MLDLGLIPTKLQETLKKRRFGAPGFIIEEGW